MVLTFVQRLISPRILRPMQHVLGLSRPIRKPAPKMVRKPTAQAASIHIPVKLPNPPRRKRLHPRGGKAIIKTKLITKTRVHPPVKRKVLEGGSYEDVLTMSVSEFHQAAERTFSRLPRSEVSEQDVVFLDQLCRASFRHDMVTGIKEVEEQIRMKRKINGLVLPLPIRPRQHEIIVRQLSDEDEKRTRLARKITKEVEETKAYWDSLVDAALAGEESPVNAIASDEEYTTWMKYQMKWDDLEAGVSVESRFDFNEIPWPTLERDKDLGLLEYEQFVLSPKRPGYRTVRWRQRLAEERRLWDVEYVKVKVVPFVAEEIRDEVINIAEILGEYLDELVGKYGQ